MADTNNNHWSLDKRIPLALIMAVFLQTTGAIWWASSVNERLIDVEEDQIVFDRRLTNSEAQISRQREQAASLVNEIKHTNEGLKILRTEVGTTNALLRQLLTENRQ